MRKGAGYSLIGLFGCGIFLTCLVSCYGPRPVSVSPQATPLPVHNVRQSLLMQEELRQETDEIKALPTHVFNRLQVHRRRAHRRKGGHNYGWLYPVLVRASAAEASNALDDDAISAARFKETGDSILLDLGRPVKLKTCTFRLDFTDRFDGFLQVFAARADDTVGPLLGVLNNGVNIPGESSVCLQQSAPTRYLKIVASNVVQTEVLLRDISFTVVSPEVVGHDRESQRD